MISLMLQNRTADAMSVLHKTPLLIYRNQGFPHTLEKIELDEKRTKTSTVLPAINCFESFLHENQEELYQYTLPA